MGSVGRIQNIFKPFSRRPDNYRRSKVFRAQAGPCLEEGSRFGPEWVSRTTPGRTDVVSPRPAHGDHRSSVGVRTGSQTFGHPCRTPTTSSLRPAPGTEGVYPDAPGNWGADPLGGPSSACAARKPTQSQGSPSPQQQSRQGASLLSGRGACF